MDDRSKLNEPDKLSQKVLDFIYQNGISYLEETRNSNKIMAQKSLLLLSYLVIAIGFFANLLIGFLKYNIYDTIDIIAIIILSALVLYYLSLIIWVVYIAKPQEVQIGYNQPKSLLSKSYLNLDEYQLSEEQHLKYMKYWCCLDIQDDISLNLSTVYKRKWHFEKALDCALIFPALFKLVKNTICHSS